MRVLWLGLLATAVGCNGIAIGGSSASESHDDKSRCPDGHRENVTDLTRRVPGFEVTPQESLDPMLGAFGGTLELTDGTSVQLAVDFSIRGSLEATVAEDYSGTSNPLGVCKSWYTAVIAIDIDAGPTLQGTADGYLDTRSSSIHVDQAAFDGFEGSLQAPEFEGTPVAGPYLELAFVFDRGSYRGDFQAVAQVETSDCEPGVSSCLAAVRRPLGHATLAPRRDE